MRNKIVLAVITASVLVSGCETVNRILPNRPIAVPDMTPRAMELQDVNFEVYTVEEMRARIDELEAQGQGNTVFYVLPKNEFDALAYNLTEMRRYIEDLRANNQFLTDAIRINNGEQVN